MLEAYHVEVTAEFARAQAEALQRALQIQSQRIQQRWSARLWFRPYLRVAGVLLAVLGVALSEWGWAHARRGAERFVGLAALFAAVGLVFALLPSLEEALRGLTRRLLGVRARRMMAQVAGLAPYQIEYALDGGVLAARVERLDLSLLLDLRTVRVAVAAPAFVCTFPQSYSMSRMRILYAEAPGPRGALLEALRSAGAEVVTLDCSPGALVAPVPG